MGIADVFDAFLRLHSVFIQVARVHGPRRQREERCDWKGGPEDGDLHGLTLFHFPCPYVAQGTGFSTIKDARRRLMTAYTRFTGLGSSPMKIRPEIGRASCRERV